MKEAYASISSTHQSIIDVILLNFHSPQQQNIQIDVTKAQVDTAS